MQKSWLKNVLFNLDAVVTGAALIITTALVIINVFMRYFLNSPLTWGEEVATGFFVWTIFMGGAVTFRNKAHLGVDIVVKMLPGKVRFVVSIITDVIVLGVLGMLTYLSVLYIMNSYTKLTNVLQISTAWFSSAIPIGFGLSLIYGIVFFVQDIRKGFSGRKEGE